MANIGGDHVAEDVDEYIESCTGLHFIFLCSGIVVMFCHVMYMLVTETTMLAYKK